MQRLFRLLFLVLHLAATGRTKESERCLFQRKEVIWKKIGDTAVLNCTIKKVCDSALLQFEWFVVKNDSHRQLERAERYKAIGSSLQIRSLNASDTGLYLCAITTEKGTDCCQPFVGEGTTLIVGGRSEFMMAKLLLWLLFTLLAIYSLALVLLIIIRRHGVDLAFSKNKSKTDTNSVKKKTQFRDVLQELHSRANVNKRKQSTRGNGCQVEAVSGGTNVSSDDIYQNV